MPARDLTGMRFGFLGVKRQATSINRQAWVVQCSCGSPEKTVLASNLIYGRTRSCGCATERLKRAKREKTNNLTNRRFGRLLVLWRAEPTGKRARTRWECKCDCGSLVKVTAENLLAEHTQSCGCLQRESRMIPSGHAGFNALFYKYQQGAIKRGIAWSLSEDEFRETVVKPCHYCGVLPQQISIKKSKNGQFAYNGVDRVNNTEGYYLGNVVPCCGIHNRMKGSMSYEKFVAACETVTRHQGRLRMEAKA